jgi:hypothetical protein
MSNEEENPLLKTAVAAETPLQKMIVEYVGNKVNPENREVTVEMIVEVMAEEFPHFVLALAEENWIRGYRQALDDVEREVQSAEQDSEGTAQEPSEGT